MTGQEFARLVSQGDAVAEEARLSRAKVEPLAFRAEVRDRFCDGP